MAKQQHCCCLDQDETEEEECCNPKNCASNCRAYGRVCPCAARYVANHVERTIHERMASNGNNNNNNNDDDDNDDDNDDATKSWWWTSSLDDFPRMAWSDLTLGSRLGEGGFCRVDQLQLPDDDDDDDNNTKNSTEEDNNGLLVIKRLRREIMVDPEAFRDGVMDLVNEALFLAAHDHPHIVRLHAVSAGSVGEAVLAASGTGDRSNPAGFFLVLDRLHETLEHRIQRWKKEFYYGKNEAAAATAVHESNNNNNKNGWYEYIGDVLSTNPIASALWTPTWENLKGLQDRLERVALPVAQALVYLHHHCVVWRDLKPANIGFDTVGNDVKLFDFGLVHKAVQPQRLDGPAAGSLRFMAPELFPSTENNNDNNNNNDNDNDNDNDTCSSSSSLHLLLAVDIYAFGLTLWQLCSFQQPFGGYTPRQHRQQVIKGGERPPMVAWWPKELQDLMQQCWSTSALERPTAPQIVTVLQNIVANLETRVAAGGQQQQDKGSLNTTTKEEEDGEASTTANASLSKDDLA